MYQSSWICLGFNQILKIDFKNNKIAEEIKSVYSNSSAKRKTVLLTYCFFTGMFVKLCRVF